MTGPMGRRRVDLVFSGASHRGVLSSLPTLFAILITLQAVLIIFHDLVDLPGWHHGRQVRAVVGRKKFWIGTLNTAVFPGIALFFAGRFWRGPVPGYAISYWAIIKFFAVCSVEMNSKTFVL